MRFKNQVFVIIALIQLYAVANAQTIQNIEGKPYLSKGSDEYSGSPMLFSEWKRARIITASGKIYTTMYVNVDVYQNLPLFFDSNKTFTFKEKINELVLIDNQPRQIFRNGKSIHPGLPDMLVEVVCDSSFLIKKYDRSLIEVPSYSTGGKSYRYNEGKTYFSVALGRCNKITLTKENAKKTFVENWNVLEYYANRKDISFKTEEGWQQLYAYYISLK